MFNILYQDNQKTYKWGKIGICLEIIEQYLPMIISLSVSHWVVAHECSAFLPSPEQMVSGE